MSRGQLILGIVIGLLVGACNAVIGNPGGRGNVPDPDIGGTSVAFSCSDSAKPEPQKLRRLGKEQYIRTLQDLLWHALGGGAGGVLNEIDELFATIPEDRADTEISGMVGSSFSRMSQGVGELHVRGYLDIARRVADLVVENEGLRRELFGWCVDDFTSDASACMRSFVADFGLWVFRRPLSEAEISFYVDTVFSDQGRSYEATPEALDDLVVAFLIAPNFLYHIENEGDEISSGFYELSPYELASRLSYHFWDSMPDEELFNAAASGALFDQQGYAEQVERVYNDSRTRESFENFFYEWLTLDRTGDPYSGVRAGDPRHLTLAGNTPVGPDLKDHMIDEVLDMGEYYRNRGNFSDLFLSRASFARTSDLASIYGVSVWDGSDNLVEFSDPDRVGLLGRAALLSAETVFTHPIIRGVRIRRNFMCDHLGDPPAGASDEIEPPSGPQTTREQVEHLTDRASCTGCHTFINGLGFPFESFDALGRHRNEELIIDDDGSYTTLPVDTGTQPRIFGEDDMRQVSGSADLVSDLVVSGKLERCFAQHYLRYTFGRPEKASKNVDGCALESLRQKLDRGEPLEEVFKSIAFEDSFKQRKRGSL